MSRESGINPESQTFVDGIPMPIAHEESVDKVIEQVEKNLDKKKSRAEMLEFLHSVPHLEGIDIEKYSDDRLGEEYLVAQEVMEIGGGDKLATNKKVESEVSIPKTVEKIPEVVEESEEDIRRISIKTPEVRQPIEPVSNPEQEEVSDTNIERLISRHEKQTTKPRISFSSIRDLKNVMKSKATEKEPVGWEAVGKLEDELKKQHKLQQLVRGLNVTPEEHIDAYKKLDSVLKLLPKSSYDGRSFKPWKENDPRKDGTIVFDHTMTEEQLHEYMALALGVVKELKPWEKPKTLEKKETEVKAEDKAKVVAAKSPEISPSKEIDKGDKLDETRLKYVQAKKALDKFESFAKIREHLSGESKERVNKAFKEAKKEYELARAEYVGSNIERHQEERLLLEKSRLQEMGKLKPELLDKLREGYKKLGDLNVYELGLKLGREYNNPGEKFMAKHVLNVRTAINGVLLGFGFTSGLVAMRMVGSFAGAHGFAEYIRNRNAEKALTVDEIKKLEDLMEVEKHLGNLIAASRLGQKDINEISASPEFIALQKKEIELLQAKGVDPNSLRAYSNISEKYSDMKVEREKKGRRTSNVIGAAAAVVGGSGILSKAKDYLPSSEAVEASAHTESEITSVDNESTAESAPQNKETIKSIPKPETTTNIPETVIQTSETPPAQSTTEHTPTDTEEGQEKIELEDDQMNIGPENIEQETLDFDQFTLEDSGESLEASVQSGIELETEAALRKYGNEKASNIAKDILGLHYRDFWNREVSLNTRELNKLQDMSVSDFLKTATHPENPPYKVTEYEALVRNINKELTQDESLKDYSLKKFVVRLAIEREKTIL